MEEKSDHKVLAKVEELLFKKSEEIIGSLTKEEKEALENAGWELSTEDIVDELEDLLEKHFETEEFSLEDFKNDLRKITKKEVFGL